MASVFKRGRDKGKRNSVWFFEYLDAAGKKRMRKGFSDKQSTEQLANKLEHEAKLRRSGLIDTEDEERAALMQSPLAEHLLAFRKSLEAKKTTDKHVKLVIARIERICQGCRFRKLSDLDATAVEQYLQELHEREDFGHRTYNHYLQAIESFGNWLVKRRKLSENPVRGIDRRNAKTDVRHQRRALTEEELLKLLESAATSDESIQCYDGPTRARIYFLSYMTGLRRAELASLTPRSFCFDGEQPTLTVEANNSKHRRKDVLPLHPELVPLLREWILGTKADEPLFPKLAKRRTWLMVKKDLERVGIPYKTADGIADFHAAGRHTHITSLVRGGVSLPLAMALARHTDVRMTMRYTHVGVDEQAAALKTLPGVWQEYGRKSSCQRGPAESPLVSESEPKETTSDDASRCEQSRFGVPRPPDSATVKNEKKWRRRESNACASCRKSNTHQHLTSGGARLSGYCQETDGLEWHQDARDDAELDVVLRKWSRLSKPTREAIARLCGEL